MYFSLSDYAFVTELSDLSVRTSGYDSVSAGGFLATFVKTDATFMVKYFYSFYRWSAFNLSTGMQGTLTTIYPTSLGPFTEDTIFTVSLSIILVTPLAFSQVSEDLFLVPGGSSALCGTTLPFTFTSSAVLFTMSLAYTFASGAYSFVYSRLTLDHSYTSSGTFLTLLADMSSYVSLV